MANQIERRIESFVESFKATNRHHTRRPSSTYSSSGSSYDPECDEIMEEDCRLRVRDVANCLLARHAIITGGRSLEGCPVVTFPDTGNFYNISDQDYHNLMLYLTAVPSMEEADLGFVLVVDRRNDKWSAVKAVLLRISGFFPGLIQEVLVLRPLGFFQKAISEVSTKLFREEFKFKLVVCNELEELYERVHPDQLTHDLGGTISYKHEEWIEERVAVEKFSGNLQGISSSLHEMTRRLQETELPNDVESTRNLLQRQVGDYKDLKEDLLGALKHGESLLGCIRHPASGHHLCPDKLANVTTVERLLVQLDETEKGFDTFWAQHERKLGQCLDLRKFEQEFKEVNLSTSARELSQTPETGDSVFQVDSLLDQLLLYRQQTQDDLEKAKQVQKFGNALISSNHYAVDSISPKCLELGSLVNQIGEELARREELLRKHRDLQERVEKANRWCTRGVDLLAGQQTDKAGEGVLHELESFLQSSQEFRLNDPKEFHAIFNDTMTPETRALVQQVLKRIEDVQTMCEKRKSSLERTVAKRPVQAVVPEPAIPFADTGRRSVFNNMSKLRMEPCLEVGPPLEDKKRSHVMAELVQTEQAYVSELHSLVQGYKKEIENPLSRGLVPSLLVGKADVLFGNMEDILEFHSSVFLKDLQSCGSTPELVGRCFAQRGENFHKLYSTYCMNKPKSESLRRQCGDDHPFFKDCQSKLGHKLPLGAYLLKPVQRITKYQLLLKDLLKEEPECPELCAAVDTMLDVLKYVNDSMHQIAITGFHGNLADYGKLLLQGHFDVWLKKEGSRELRFKPHRRFIFLYEQLILLTKRGGTCPDSPSYAFKNALKTSQIGMTENVRNSRGSDQRKFEVWLHGRTQVFTIQASTVQTKQIWIKEIKRVLLHQFETIKDANIKQYSNRLSEKGGTNGLALEKSRHALGSLSWDNCSPASCGKRQHAGELGRRATLPTICGGFSQELEEDEAIPEDGWSTDELSEGEEDGLFADRLEATGSKFTVLGEYQAVDIGEASLREGQVVEVQKVGGAGWWFVRVCDSSSTQGWVPASYLGPTRKRASASPSISSQDSACGLPRAISRSSVASSELSLDCTT